ncbi:MAG: STAS domain-containing protein [Chitinivibrionia bacterium]|nr:STAS domain-containing protein [Chitinivibrionia bacterium]
MDISITKTRSGEKTVIAIEGWLGATTVPKLEEVLIPAFDETKQVELDFDKLAHVFSAGLRVLLLGEKTAKAKGGKLTVVNVSPEIKDVFDMTGFSDILEYTLKSE